MKHSILSCITRSWNINKTNSRQGTVKIAILNLSTIWHICFNSSTSSRHKSYLICFSGVLFIFTYGALYWIYCEYYISVCYHKSQIQLQKLWNRIHLAFFTNNPYICFSFSLNTRQDRLVCLNSPQKISL